MRKAISNFRDNLLLFLLPCRENGGRARIFAGNFLIFFFLFLVILKIAFASFVCYFPKTSLYADVTKSALIQKVNQDRAESDLPVLSESATLDRAAYLKALDMVKNGYFDHISPSGVNPWHWFKRAGYNYRYAGENLAIGFVDSGEVHNAWMASPTHKANIMNGKYREIGVAVVNAKFQGNPATIVVQLFGSKQGVNKVAVPLAPDAKGQVQNKATGGNAGGLGAKAILGSSNISGAIEDSASLRMVMFMVQKYFGAVQWLVYFSLLAVILLAIGNYLLWTKTKHVDLLVKIFGFVAITAVFAMIDHSSIIYLVPHDLSIF